MFKKIMGGTLVADALTLAAPAAAASPTSGCGLQTVTDPAAPVGAAAGCVTGQYDGVTPVTDDVANGSTGYVIASVAIAVGTVVALPPWAALCLAVAVCAACYAVARAVPIAVVPRAGRSHAPRSRPGWPVGSSRTALVPA